MGQSLTYLLVHIIFSTKDRRPFINDSVAPRLHAYLATLVRNLDCACYRVGGVEDHVHLAVRMKSSIDVAEIVEQIKVNSSKWIKPLDPSLKAFSWQRGYGAFSVSPQYRPALIAYIEDQKNHHKTQTFQDEFRTFLGLYEMEYKEQYVWE